MDYNFDIDGTLKDMEMVMGIANKNMKGVKDALNQMEENATDEVASVLVAKIAELDKVMDEANEASIKAAKAVNNRK